MLLDEIGDLPLTVQAKVLRVLETRSFERVGGERPEDVPLLARRLAADHGVDPVRLDDGAEALASLTIDAAIPPAAVETAIRDALRATDGDKRAAAERLGLSYRTPQRRVHQYDLEGYPKYRP